MADRGADGYDYPPEVRFEVDEPDLESYRRAADFLNFANTDVVCLQHEYGIDGGVRLFSLLPPPADWEAVFAGDADPEESGLYPYELVLTPGTGCGAEFRDAAENGAFDRALAEGWSE